MRRRLERMVVDREMQAILEFADRDDEDSTAWRRRAGLTTALALVSAEEAEQLKPSGWRCWSRTSPGPRAR
ncbi:hypothetical protein [Actinoplanes sp. CA-252034]|uniref:hypothetical protein n=1 Tax=Actinoplanes sp. CA-252034 TaxID=3239906 RepID=UPI003D9754C9